MKRVVAWLKTIWPGEEKRIAGAYQGMFGDGAPHRPAVLQDLVRFCNLDETSFTVGDAQVTAFNEGKRAVLLHIADMTGIEPAELVFKKPMEE